MGRILLRAGRYDTVIPVQPAPEPATFNDKVRVPGRRAVAERVGKKPNPPRTSGRPNKQAKRTVKGSKTTQLITREEDLSGADYPPYWTRVLPDLLDSYNRTCAFASIHIPRITGAESVDHFAPKSTHWQHVYEWDNYRLACQLMNARKNNFEDLIDAFDVQDDWFELDFVGFQIRATSHLPVEQHAAWKATLERLHLNDAEFRKAREEHYDLVRDGLVTLGYLETWSPFVAREIRRQGKLPHLT